MIQKIHFKKHHYHNKYIYKRIHHDKMKIVCSIVLVNVVSIMHHQKFETGSGALKISVVERQRTSTGDTVGNQIGEETWSKVLK